MNRKERKLVEYIQVKKGDIYTEDFYGEKIVDEKVVKKLIDHLVNTHQFRASQEAVTLYKEEPMSTYLFFMMLAAIVNSQELIGIRYGITSTVCKIFYRKEKEFLQYYTSKDPCFCDIFLHFYYDKSKKTRYRIFSYLISISYYIQGVGFDEKPLKENFGNTWWQLPVSEEYLL